MLQQYEYINGTGKTDITIDGVDVSEEVFTKCFMCDLKRCKGACCARKEEDEIDYGAALQENEIKIIEEILPKSNRIFQRKVLTR